MKWVAVALGGAAIIYVLAFANLFPIVYDSTAAVADAASTTPRLADTKAALPPLDTVAYNKKMLELAHVATSSPWYNYFLTGEMPQGTTTLKKQAWPVKAAYPNPGALLPFNRIVAYYGNFYSKNMGVLGQYPEEEMLTKLRAAVAQWEAADPTTPVVPAIDYIAITAQESPGKDGKYRLRMPDSQIDKALALADKVNGIVILDVQVGLSTLQTELPIYEDYLAKPNVHLAIDPEFSMKSGAKPGTEIGTFSSADVNYAAQYLASLVQKNNLPPKILVVHRFTQGMMTGYKNIKPLPEVQIVVDMDGWGFGAKKINTYKTVVTSEPVQFAGFKLFYKNDIKPPSTRLLTPAEVLSLTPAPVFIQYQ
ncbi:MAG: hypothetical protein QG621_284 [Patescibacteria group bacterium]|nr:hypothetical protein [Patescibacteria group bacterium]